MKVTFTFKSPPAARLIAAALAVVGAHACAAAGGVPLDPSDQKWASERWPGTTMSDLSRGHDVFVARCASCHGLPRPDAKSPDEWNVVLDEMGARAKLSATDRELVNRYLSATSQRLRSSSARTQAGASTPAL